MGRTTGMTIAEALTVLDFRVIVGPDGYAFYDSSRDVVKFEDIQSRISDHEEVLKDLAVASSEGIIGGTQWYHGQQLRALIIVRDKMQKALK